MFLFFFEWYVDHRDLHVRTHCFPTRRSSDLRGLFEAARWEPLLSQYSYQDPVANPPPLPDFTKVVDAVIAGPDGSITNMAYTLANVVERRADAPRKRAFYAVLRSGESRGGKRCVSTCRLGWSPEY